MRVAVAGRIPWLHLWALLAYGVLFAPIAVIVVFSFNAPRGRLNLLWQGFSVEAWHHPLSVPALWEALRTRLQLALARRRLRGVGWIELLLVLPLTSPEIVLGTALLGLFARLNLPLGFPSLLLVHSLFCLS
jgi:spermidine/putrescine transport system permease protein